MEWEPISTAPKDRLILLYMGPEAICQGMWLTGIHKETKEEKQAWFAGLTLGNAILVQPTHWSELPEPPILGVEDGTD